MKTIIVSGRKICYDENLEDWLQECVEMCLWDITEAIKKGDPLPNMAQEDWWVAGKEGIENPQPSTSHMYCTHPIDDPSAGWEGWRFYVPAKGDDEIYGEVQDIPITAIAEIIIYEPEDDYDAE